MTASLIMSTKRSRQKKMDNRHLLLAGFNSSEIEWREGEGLFIKPRWTDKAREHIQAGEYKYLSAVFSYDKQTGEPTQLRMAALVNYPGIDGMEEVVTLAANHFASKSQSMAIEKIYCSILKLLDIHVKDDKPTEVDHRKAMDTVEALKLKLKPNLSNYVPREVYQGIKDEIAVLKNKKLEESIEVIIDYGMRQKKVATREVQWLSALGKQQGLVALRQIIDERLSPDELVKREKQLAVSPEEESVMQVCGLDREAYLKARNSN